MTMKQTQTKMFDFSDTGLDFCAGSKTLFPDRFKKMLSLGYNVQTVSSVTVAGNQVTFTYGGAHGYAADRVLMVDSGALASINGGEFWVDSVTVNTVTMTIDGAPPDVAAGFTSRIAPMGWQLVYEKDNIHVYKFKQFDESDIFIRLCFQNQAGRRNCISPCVGKTFDALSGTITDPLALTANASLASPGDGFKWEFSGVAAATYDSFTYSQGYGTFGKGVVIGSLYHVGFLTSASISIDSLRVNGCFPSNTHNFESLKYPVLLGETYGNIASSGDWYQSDSAVAYIGKIGVTFHGDGSPRTGLGSNKIFPVPVAFISSFLSPNVDSFNTTTLEPIRIFELSTYQHLGYISGIYLCRYAQANRPPFSRTTSPSVSYDIDLNSKVYLHGMGWDSSTSALYLGVPVEEVKIGY